MPRIRSIHPGLWTDERFVSVSFPARLLWQGILNHADDQGVFPWKPITLKMQILPADNVDCVALLAELTEADLVRRFEANGVSYGAVRGFQAAQNPKKPTAVHPLPADLRGYVRQRGQVPNQFGTGSPPPPDRGELDEDEAAPVPPNAEIGPLMERRGGEEEVPPPEPPQGGAPEGFDAFWDAYPRKEERGHAERAWRVVTADTPVAEILAGLRRFQFGADPPKPQQWLRGKRWADAPSLGSRQADAAEVLVDERIRRVRYDRDGRARQPSLVRTILANDLAALQAFEVQLRAEAAESEDGPGEVVRLPMLGKVA